jgi:phenylalanine ammonia-lyase
MAMRVDERFNNGLPPNLAPKPGLFSGFKGMQLCLTSLVCALRQLASPSLIHTLPTEQYNQDMVSLECTRH